MDDLPPVLVAEDEALIRAALVEALQDGGYSVLEAESGSAAIEQLENVDHLRGLVTDIRMGAGADGWEVAHRARHCGLRRCLPRSGAGRNRRCAGRSSVLNFKAPCPFPSQPPIHQRP